jgi:A/G-specific adenine glycosylase
MLCPWKESCAAHAQGDVERYPARTAKAERPTRRGVAFVMLRDDKVWLRRREEKGLLGGMLEAPSTPWRAEAWEEKETARHAPLKAKWTTAEGVRHVFTHFALELDVRVARVTASPDGEGAWRKLDEVDRLALPSLTVRVIRAALQDPRQPTRARARPRIMPK